MKTVKILVLVALVTLLAVPSAGAQLVGKWDSSFTVVNFGTAAASVTVTFYDDSGNEYIPAVLDAATPTPTPNPFTLPAGRSYVVYLPGIPATELADGRYSVAVTADQPIAAIANMVGLNGEIGFNGSYSGAGDNAQTSQYLPSVNKAFWGWNSHLSVQNLTGDEQIVTVDFYSGTLTSINTVTETVAAYSSWHLDVAGLTGVPDNYNGSAIATAAGPIAAIDNQTNDPLGNTQDYNAFSGGATTMYCPALYDNFFTWNSSLSLQNVGATTTTVYISYSDGTTETRSLGPSAGALFYQPDETHTAATFSALITATGPIVAAVNAANPVNQAQTYNCFSAGATSFFAPIVEKGYFGWDSGIQVQNLTDNPTTVTVTYEITGCVVPYPIAANGTVVITQHDESCLPDGYGASATITADQLIAVIVNQTMGANQTGAKGDWSMSYNAIGQ